MNNFKYITKFFFSNYFWFILYYYFTIIFSSVCIFIRIFIFKYTISKSSINAFKINNIIPIKIQTVYFSYITNL